MVKDIERAARHQPSHDAVHGPVLRVGVFAAFVVSHHHFVRKLLEELLQAARLVERLARAVPLRRSRRVRVAKDGRVFDKRRTLRAAMRTDGYPITRLWREPRMVPRKLVFIAQNANLLGATWNQRRARKHTSDRTIG